MSETVRTCSVCIMDDSVLPLAFDAKGQCDCCRNAIRRWPHDYFPNAEGQRRLETLVRTVKAQGKGRPYDCMIGLSGGIDSAYVAHLLRTRFDLRLLAVHVDAGWNTEAAVHNIENLVRKLDIDLHTQVVEWEEIRDLQVAFLRAGVINQDMPQDHAFFATLYRLANARGIKTFLSGVNFATESIGQPEGGHPSIDGKHISSIHRRFGKVPLTTYPVMAIPEYLWLSRVRGTPRIARPLDLVNYNQGDAREILRTQYGWKPYGSKHSEFRFTKFYQQIYLPRRLGLDKRRWHLSSLVVTNQMTREQALDEISRPVMDVRQQVFDIRYVAKKLQISADELVRLIDMPIVPHSKYDGDFWILDAAHKLREFSRSVMEKVVPA